MTAFQRILINTERWNETVVTPSLAKPQELIFTPNIYIYIYAITCRLSISCEFTCPHIPITLKHHRHHIIDTEAQFPVNSDYQSIATSLANNLYRFHVIGYT